MGRGHGRRIVGGAVAAGALVLAACGGGQEAEAEAGGRGSAASSTTAATVEPPTTVPTSGDVFTPVIGSLMGPDPQAVEGTDGRFHVVYEIQFTNTKPAPATLQRVDVVDPAAPDEPIASYEGADLVERLVTLHPHPAPDAVIAPDASLVLFVELAFDAPEAVPTSLAHHVQLLGAANPGTAEPTPLAYTIAPVDLSADPPPVLGPPVSGDRWVAVNGCCLPTVIHRGSFQSVNGVLYDAQRFAIDWMRLDEEGRLVSGDPTVASNYPDYGAEVLAVADATVVSTLDTLDDQVPGTLPNPADITIDTVDGNHVVLDLGDGHYVFYAHLQKGSVTVEPGDRVTRGQVLGLLGNSGNTSGPHLHLHVMDAPSPLASQGLPYVIRGFTVTGQIDAEAFAASPGIEGVWLSGPQPEPVEQVERFPLNLDVVTFP